MLSITISLPIFLYLLTNLANCQQPCIPNPCRQGNCIPNGASFRCDCFTQYGGLLCDELIINPCQPNPCNSGVCTSNDGRTFKCICSPNFTGTRCDIRISESIDNSIGPCKPSNPCFNSGVCTSNDGRTFKCICSPNFTGTRCDIRISESIDNSIGPCKPSNPCFNSGVCTSNDGRTFKCICSPNFTGTRCDIRISESIDNSIGPCKPSNPCFNSGVCTSNDGRTFKCICSPNFTGTRCEIKTTQSTDPCKPFNPCQNSGNCIPITQFNTNPPFACVCQPRFTGQRCESLVNALSDGCNPNPCNNGGTCVNVPNANPSFACICKQGYTGVNCVQLISNSNQNSDPSVNLCNNQVCYNGGTCVTQNIGNFQYKVVCLCNNGFTGSRCEQTVNSINNNNENTNINFCQNVNCNSGICINLQNGFNCKCPIGQSGQFCQNVVSNPTQLTLGCAQPFCLNGGTCYTNTSQSVSFPTCVCNRGYLGLLCEFDVCKQNFDYGACNGLFMRYYYNVQTKRCEQFNYGGCRGNTNNFETKNECELVCNGR